MPLPLLFPSSSLTPPTSPWLPPTRSRAERPWDEGAPCRTLPRPRSPLRHLPHPTTAARRMGFRQALGSTPTAPRMMGFRRCSSQSPSPPPAPSPPTPPTRAAAATAPLDPLSAADLADEGCRRRRSSRSLSPPAPVGEGRRHFSSHASCAPCHRHRYSRSRYYFHCCCW